MCFVILVLIVFFILESKWFLGFEKNFVLIFLYVGLYVNRWVYNGNLKGGEDEKICVYCFLEKNIFFVWLIDLELVNFIFFCKICFFLKWFNFKLLELIFMV